jgi:hypothetical protein
LRNTILVLAALAAIGVLVHWKLPRLAGASEVPAVTTETQTPNPEPQAEQRAATEAKQESQQAAETAVPTSTSASTSAPQQHAPLISVTPTLQNLRDDIAKDPHNAPASMIKFAVELGHRMDDAEKSRAFAGDFLDDLESCTLSGDNASSIRALCLSHANRLSAKYEDMKPRVENLARRADPEVTRLLQ